MSQQQHPVSPSDSAYHYSPPKGREQELCEAFLNWSNEISAIIAEGGIPITTQKISVTLSQANNGWVCVKGQIILNTMIERAMTND